MPELFFSPFFLLPSFQFPPAFTLTKLLLCEPTARRVTFLLARRQILGILRMQMQLGFLLCVKQALSPHIDNLFSFFFCSLLIFLYVYVCRNEIEHPHKLLLPDYKNCKDICLSICSSLRTSDELITGVTHLCTEAGEGNEHTGRTAQRQTLKLLLKWTSHYFQWVK